MTEREQLEYIGSLMIGQWADTSGIYVSFKLLDDNTFQFRLERSPDSMLETSYAVQYAVDILEFHAEKWPQFKHLFYNQALRILHAVSSKTEMLDVVADIEDLLMNTPSIEDENAPRYERLMKELRDIYDELAEMS